MMAVSEILTVNGVNCMVGEVRQQGFIVRKSNGAALSDNPTDATYRRYRGGEAIDIAPVAAIIEGVSIYADIPAGTTIGAYVAVFTYTLGDETVKTKVYYKVQAAM